MYYLNNLLYRFHHKHCIILILILIVYEEGRRETMIFIGDELFCLLVCCYLGRLGGSLCLSLVCGLVSWRYRR